jgi:hypothetical protein
MNAYVPCENSVADPVDAVRTRMGHVTMAVIRTPKKPWPGSYSTPANHPGRSPVDFAGHTGTLGGEAPRLGLFAGVEYDPGHGNVACPDTTASGRTPKSSSTISSDIPLTLGILCAAVEDDRRRTATEFRI